MIKIVLKSCQILKIVTLHVLYNAGLNNCYQSHGDITLEKNDRTAKKKKKKKVAEENDVIEALKVPIKPSAKSSK
jgi:hypothetical protein